MAAFTVSVCTDIVSDNMIISIRNIYFNVIIGFLLVVLILFSLIKRIGINIHYNGIDISILIYFLFVFLNYILRGLPVDNSFITLFSVFIFYWLSKYLFFIASSTSKKIIIILLLFFGLVQGMLGTFQLLGIIPSLNGLFRITGSFLNPGPYSVYLVCSVPFALSIYLFCTERKPIDYALKYVAALNVFFSVLVLPQTQSRTAWIASAVGVVMVVVIRFKLASNFLIWIKLLRHKLYVTLTIICLFATCTFIYKLKEDSANGRLLIWNVARNMVKENPFLGIGYNGVKRDYNDYQAAYFEKNSNNYEEIRIANQVNYVFNDYLQILIEQGILGLFLFLCVIAVSLIKAFKSLYYNDQLSSLNLALVTGAACSIILLMVSFLSTYSLETLPIAINFVFYLALISSFSTSKFSISSPKKVQQYGLAMLGTAAILVCIVICKKEIKTYASFHAVTKNDIDRLKTFKENYAVLKNEPTYLLQYGKLLASKNFHKESIDILTTTSRFLCDTSLYRSLGDSYRVLGKHKEAQWSYLKSVYIAPHRFLPRYYLVKSYLESGDTTNALAMADYIVRLPVKIDAPIVYQIKDEMKELIHNLKDL